jgi:hypothetical protein
MPWATVGAFAYRSPVTLTVSARSANVLVVGVAQEDISTRRMALQESF